MRSHTHTRTLLRARARAHTRAGTREESARVAWLFLCVLSLFLLFLFSFLNNFETLKWFCAKKLGTRFLLREFELLRGREKERKTRSLVFPQTANGNASLLLSLFSRARAFELLLVYAHTRTRTIMASNATTTGGAHHHLQDVSNNDIINGTTTARKSTRRTGGGGAQQHQNSNNNNNNVSSMMMMTTDPASKNHNNNNNNSINGEKRWQVSARD